MSDQVLIVFDTSSLNNQQLIDKTTTVAAKLADAANAARIVGLPYTPVQYQGLLDDYTGARQAQLLNKQSTAPLTVAKNSAEVKLEKATMAIVRSLESRPNLTELDVTSLGFAVRAAASPPNIVAPEDLSITFGDVAGSVSAHWQPLADRVTYVLQYRLANTPGAPWVTGYTNTASDCRVTGLTPGALYEFQVCAIFSGVENPGPACAVVEHRAA